MPAVGPIIERLNRARAGLEAAAGQVSADLWRQPPHPGAWSAADVIGHLTTVETAITEGAARMIQAQPRPVPLLRRIHVPVIFAEWRFLKRKTPISTDPALLLEKAEMMGRLADLRRRTLAFLEANAGPNLRAYRWRHPFLGSLHFYDWFRVMAHHEVRHTKQIREIVEFFQK